MSSRFRMLYPTKIRLTLAAIFFLLSYSSSTCGQRSDFTPEEREEIRAVGNQCPTCPDPFKDAAKILGKIILVDSAEAAVGKGIEIATGSAVIAVGAMIVAHFVEKELFDEPTPPPIVPNTRGLNVTVTCYDSHHREVPCSP